MENMSVEELAALLRTAILRNGKTWNETAVEILKTFEESEDQYEYNIERTSGVTGKTSMCYGDSGWDSDLEVVREDFKMYGEGEKATSLGASYRIVKRHKAGGIEDV